VSVSTTRASTPRPGTGNEKGPVSGTFRGGRYWARTSDPQLVDAIVRVTFLSSRFGLAPSKRFSKPISAAGGVRSRERQNPLYRAFGHQPGTVAELELSSRVGRRLPPLWPAPYSGEAEHQPALGSVQLSRLRARRTTTAPHEQRTLQKLE
jgi:hypothetical protein